MNKNGINAILIERDYKGEYERFALTEEEFQKEFVEQRPDIDFSNWDKTGDTFTLRSLVHIWIQETIVDSDSWNTFFTDMEEGLPESDIENGNLAYVREDLMPSLKEYLPQNKEKEIDNRIQFEERYDSEVYKTTTLYFMSEKSLLDEILPGKYPEAESMEISVEFPTDKPEAHMASVMISPTKDGEDYDWTSWNILNEKIEGLIDLGMKAQEKVKPSINEMIEKADERKRGINNDDSFSLVLNNIIKGEKFVQCSSLLDCVNTLCAYRDSLSMASSDMSVDFGDVYKDNTKVYSISYNGRVQDCKIKDKSVFINPETNAYYKLDDKLKEIPISILNSNLER